MHIFRLGFLLIVITSSFAFAQMDLSSQIVQSGRYQVRKLNSIPVPSSTRVSNQKPSTKVDTRKPASEASPTEASESQIISEDLKMTTQKAEPSISDQTKSIFGTGYEDVVKFYRESIHPDDIRNNKVELMLASSFVYNDSNSNYSYRNYKGAYPTIGFGADVWLTPGVGVGGKMDLSLGAAVAGDSVTHSMTPVRHEDMEFSYKMRKFQGLSRKSTSIECGILYSDFKFNVSTDSLNRPRWRSYGFGFSVQSKVPSQTSQNVFVFGGTLYPRLQHTEMKTGAVMASGTPSENIRVSLDIGSEYRYSKDQQLVLMLNLMTERNLFDGQASAVDPETSQTPSNVTVTNGSIGLSLGFKWGH